jgi:hypothetical protein
LSRRRTTGHREECGVVTRRVNIWAGHCTCQQKSWLEQGAGTRDFVNRPAAPERWQMDESIYIVVAYVVGCSASQPLAGAKGTAVALLPPLALRDLAVVIHLDPSHPPPSPSLKSPRNV